MTHRISAIVLFCGLAIFVAACTTAPSRFYTLSATPGTAAPSSDLTVAVGPVSIPAVVDRPQIVFSTGPNQVRMDELNRWASPLQDNIARVVADDLAAMLGTMRVALSLQALGKDPDYGVTIEVQSFESVPSKETLLDAVWTVRRTKDGTSETGRTTVREDVQGDGYDMLAAAHSRALDRMSQDIAAAVQRLAHSGP
jgi:uncharacterized protein